jgi:hypothetical protein
MPFMRGGAGSAETLAFGAARQSWDGGSSRASAGAGARIARMTTDTIERIGE